MKKISTPQNDFQTIQAMPFPQDERMHSFTQNIVVGIHHFYLDEPSIDFKHHVELVNTLKTAEPHDTIFIYLGTPGGNLNVAIRIINAIKMCNGTVITVLDGEVASAGTLIFLAGHKKMVFPHSGFMIHTLSMGTDGTLNNSISRVKFVEKWWNDVCNEYYKGFLTDEELDRVIRGEELWLTSPEVIDRLDSDQLLLNEAPANNLESKLPQLIEELIKSGESLEVAVEKPVEPQKRKTKKNAKRAIGK